MSNDAAFDPTAPDIDSKPSSAYVSRKDVKIVAIGLVFFGLLLWPIFIVLARRSEKSRCILNLKAISQAMNQYATQNDEKFPPLFEAGDGNAPVLQSSGAPFTWASNLVDFMNPRASFQCPSAEPAELSRSQDPRSASNSFALTYGMFAPLSAFSRSLVDDPNEAVLIAESSNRGALKSYDPIPFTDAAGNPLPYDGMVIGWDSDNFDGSDKSKFVTRLAFPDTASGDFKKSGEGRHDEGSMVVTVAGQLRSVRPNVARVQRRNGDIFGTWPMPLTARHNQ